MLTLVAIWASLKYGSSTLSSGLWRYLFPHLPVFKRGEEQGANVFHHRCEYIVSKGRDGSFGEVTSMCFCFCLCVCLFYFYKSTWFSFFFFINLFYFWLCWVFVSVRGLSLVAASGGHSSSRCAGLSPSRPLVAEHRLQTRRLSSCGSRA